jgi:cation:H+ antiporter
VGHRLRLPPGLIGLVTALGADSPEISFTATAIIGGQHDLGRGVIFGSNIFNVAMRRRCMCGHLVIAVGA